MGKTAMKHLIEKINRMPETSIKNFIKLLGDEYLIQEKEQIKDAWLWGQEDGATECTPNQQSPEEKYYNETYGNAND